MVSKRFGPFHDGGTRFFQHGEPQEAAQAPLSLVTSQKRPHLSPVFMLYAKNYNAIHFQRGERLISPERNCSPPSPPRDTHTKLAASPPLVGTPISSSFCLPPPRPIAWPRGPPGLHFSHKFHQEWENTRWTVKKNPRTSHYWAAREMHLKE